MEPEHDFLSSEEKASWHLKRGSERTRLSVWVPKEIADRIDKMWLTMPDKPFRSRDDFLRHVLRAGFEELERVGLPVSSLLLDLALAIREEEYDRWREYNEGLLSRFRQRVHAVRTTRQREEVQRLAADMIARCSDPVVASEIEHLLRTQLP